MKLGIARVLTVAVAFAALSSPLWLDSTAEAATATSNLSVDATVAANCSITTTAVAFGSYDPIVTNKTTDLTANGAVNVTCTSGSAATITLGQGSNAEATSTAGAPLRQMANGTNRLKYGLYSESTRTTVWGDTAATGLAHTGTGAAVALTVYGKVAAGQNMPAGAYADTVVATVTF